MMNVSNELLFFFSALGAFNGLLLGLYFSFYKKPKHISNFFLGAMLICLSIRIGKSVFFYFNHDLDFRFLQFGLTACLFIGPFLYLYLKSIYDKTGHNASNWRIHMYVWIPIITLINFLYPFETHVNLWRPYIIKGIYAVWILYTIASFPYVRKIMKSLKYEPSGLNAQSLWDLSLFIGNILIWAAFFFCGFTSYILGALLFSFVFYLLFLQIIFRNREELDARKTSEKYKSKKIDSDQAENLLGKLNQYILDGEKFKNPNLKLAELASALNVLPHTVSQVLNDNLGKSFTLYINEFRVEEAKKRIALDEQYTLESIGYDCGFNSKSTFYGTFKKMTGHTPSSYKKLIK